MKKLLLLLLVLVIGMTSMVSAAATATCPNCDHQFEVPHFEFPTLPVDARLFNSWKVDNDDPQRLQLMIGGEEGANVTMTVFGVPYYSTTGYFDVQIPSGFSYIRLDVGDANKVKEIRTYDSIITNVGLQQIFALPYLQKLRLGADTWAADGLNYTDNDYLTELEVHYIANSPIGDYSGEYVGAWVVNYYGPSSTNFPNLKYLDLSKVGNLGTSGDLYDMSFLEYVDCSDTNAMPVTIQTVANLPYLKTLKLRGRLQVGGSGMLLDKLNYLPALEYLDLAYSRASYGNTPLSTPTNLQYIDMTNLQFGQDQTVIDGVLANFKYLAEVHNVWGVKFKIREGNIAPSTSPGEERITYLKEQRNWFFSEDGEMYISLPIVGAGNGWWTPQVLGSSGAIYVDGSLLVTFDGVIPIANQYLSVGLHNAQIVIDTPDTVIAMTLYGFWTSDGSLASTKFLDNMGDIWSLRLGGTDLSATDFLTDILQVTTMKYLNLCDCDLTFNTVADFDMTSIAALRELNIQKSTINVTDFSFIEDFSDIMRYFNVYECGLTTAQIDGIVDAAYNLAQATPTITRTLWVTNQTGTVSAQAQTKIDDLVSTYGWTVQ